MLYTKTDETVKDIKMFGIGVVVNNFFKGAKLLSTTEEANELTEVSFKFAGKTYTITGENTHEIADKLLKLKEAWDGHESDDAAAKSKKTGRGNK